MLKRLHGLVFDDVCHDPVEVEDMTSKETSKQQTLVPKVASKKSKKCYFFLLPVELRWKIYAYTDQLAGYTIEISHLHVTETPLGPQCHVNSSTLVTDRQLLYHYETEGWRQYPPKRERCLSILGLFVLPNVCRQMRADTKSLVYGLNTFGFSDRCYNYGSAIQAWTKSLSEREKAAVKTIYWPLRQAILFQQSLHGVRIQEPDRPCVDELRSLPNLKKVVLRYTASDLQKRKGEFSVDEENELVRLFAEAGRVWDYGVEREFRRELAMRGMKSLIGNGKLEVECRVSRRAAFWPHLTVG